MLFIQASHFRMTHEEKDANFEKLLSEVLFSADAKPGGGNWGYRWTCSLAISLEEKSPTHRPFFNLVRLGKPTMIFIRGNDPLHELMADDIAF